MLTSLIFAITIVSLAATLYIRPSLVENYRRLPVLYLIPVLVAASLVSMWHANRKGAECNAFLSSCVYLILMLVGAAAAFYPNLLVSTTDPSLNITVEKAHSSHYALSIGLIWWSLGMAIAVGYFIFVYRSFRGKVRLSSHGEGY